MEGRQIGAYRLIQPIGKGGFGEVWLAEHAMLGRRAAVKLLNAQVSMDSSIVTRFFNEARAATAIDDPGIVAVYDFGQTPEGTAFIVMELLAGETLEARMRARGVLPVGEALQILRRVARSLGAAHAHGIVHRDLKPENIFLVHDPEVAGQERTKILDFGIAKLSPELGMTSQTQSTALLGTPGYMSPEQCRGAGGVGKPSDVYSAGCMLFRMLVGRLPFIAAGVGEMIALHITAAPPRAASLASHISPAVDALIARCLEKDPAQRYADGAALAQALDTLLQDAGVHTSAIGPTAVAFASTLATGDAATVAATTAAAPPPRRRMRWVVVAAALVAVAGVAVAVGVATTHDTDDAPPPKLAIAPAPDAARPPPVDAAVTMPADAEVVAAVGVDAAPLLPTKPPPKRKVPVDAPSATLSTGDAAAANDAGKEHMYASDFAGAIAEFQRAEHLAPEVAQYAFNLCTAYFQVGKFSDGLAACKRARAHASESDPRLVGKIELLNDRIRKEMRAQNLPVPGE